MPRFSYLVVALGLGGVGALTAGDVPLSVDAAHSRVEFAVKSTGHSFTGTLEKYDAHVTVDAKAEHVTEADFKFEVADLSTGDEARDREMLAWFEQAKFPQADFTLEKLVPEADGRLEATGKFTLHGVAHELEFPVTVSTDNRLYAIDGDVTLDTRDYGLPIIRKYLILKVDPMVRVTFHVQGTTPAPRS